MPRTGTESRISTTLGDNSCGLAEPGPDGGTPRPGVPAVAGGRCPQCRSAPAAAIRTAGHRWIAGTVAVVTAGRVRGEEDAVRDRARWTRDVPACRGPGACDTAPVNRSPRPAVTPDEALAVIRPDESLGPDARPRNSRSRNAQPRLVSRSTRNVHGPIRRRAEGARSAQPRLVRAAPLRSDDRGGGRTCVTAPGEQHSSTETARPTRRPDMRNRAW
jgi:hypothetical protein